MSSITYVDNFLSASSNANVVDDHLRDYYQDIALGVSTSFYWPGDGGGSFASTGEMLDGTGKLAGLSNATSISSSLWTAPPAGYLHFEAHAEDKGPGDLTTARNIWSWSESAITTPLGGSYMMEHSYEPDTAPFGSRWVIQSGRAMIVHDLDESTGTISVTFPYEFTFTPFVQITHEQHDQNVTTPWWVWIDLAEVHNYGFLSSWSQINAHGFGSGYTTYINWRSMGTLPWGEGNNG